MKRLNQNSPRIDKFFSKKNKKENSDSSSEEEVVIMKKPKKKLFTLKNLKDQLKNNNFRHPLQLENMLRICSHISLSCSNGCPGSSGKPKSPNGVASLTLPPPLLTSTFS